ncbi:hypothetical protein AYI69_g9300 [Smittium culicis]|uniref:Uncharacterized protein n=1 Tax=Smittium culicis TaxID=133412 RepID=A0A1R1XDK6_9FUNG|nr:hypothetical protein AYI69_g9300 [Smittium culicis]
MNFSGNGKKNVQSNSKNGQHSSINIGNEFILENQNDIRLTDLSKKVSLLRGAAMSIPRTGFWTNQLPPSPESRVCSEEATATSDELSGPVTLNSSSYWSLP